MSASDLSDFQTPDARSAADSSGNTSATGIVVDTRWRESEVADILTAACKVEFR
jgi:hypothetical protein